MSLGELAHRAALKPSLDILHSAMSKEEIQTATPHSRAANDGVAAALTSDGLKSLAGFFDVLIQMDFEQKLKQRIKNEETNIEIASPNNALDD